jgi:hypothetical protein
MAVRLAQERLRAAMFGFKEIIGISSWTVVLTAILVVLGFFTLPVLLFVWAVFGLAMFFGSKHF